MAYRALLFDPVAEDRADLARYLAEAGSQVTVAATPEEVLAHLSDPGLELVLLTLAPGGSFPGLELARQVSARLPGACLVLIAPEPDLSLAVDAVGAGAENLLVKPLTREQVLDTCSRAVHTCRARAEREAIRERTTGRDGFGELLGSSRPMRRVFEILGRAIGSDASILVNGETGTGKEVVAQVIHREGKRRDGPFLAVNCMALPEELLESELFGHMQGAFTDAKATRKGLFLQASGGTLLLDEIGDMPMGIQGKILRALETRKVRPLGGEEEVEIDVRLIAATHRDLTQAIEARTFRQDLYFRINVLGIRLPPLRERGNDVLLLAQRFLAETAGRAGKRIRGFTPKATACLMGHPWPGNVRELRNCVEAAVAMCEGTEIDRVDLPEPLRSARVKVAAPQPGGAEMVPLADVERRHILAVLAATGGNKREAARILGVNRTTLYRKLAIYEIDGK